MTRISTLLTLLCAAVASWLPATARADSPARFAEPPRVDRQGDGWTITFSAAAACDATVAIIDENGRIVRHLASGVLGPNAPAPLARDSLTQKLFWDGRDDRGVVRLSDDAREQFKVRVSLGLTPTLDRVIGQHPYDLGNVRMLATGPDGQVYAFHVQGALHPADGTAQCSVFDRDGRYLRTILPYPANLPEERLAGVRRVQIAPGVRVPFIYQVETRSLLPGAGDLPSARAVVARDGRVAFVGIHELGRYAQAGQARLTVIRSDGAIPEPVLGPQISPRTQSGVSLALSPDEQTLYATGLAEKQSAHAVYRVGWNDEQAQPFIGTPGAPGAGPSRLNNPTGLATDAAGRLYVADRGNDRVAVFATDGKFLGAIAVEAPFRVEVHPRDGQVYVLAGRNKELLIKFSGYRDAQEIARLRLPYFSRDVFSPVMALDGSAERAVVWVGSSHDKQYSRYGLLRIEDEGAAFGAMRDLTATDAQRPSVGPVLDIGLDRAGERLYVGRKGFSMAFDGRTGEPVEFRRDPRGGSGNTAAVGRDGHIYLFWDFPVASLNRYDLLGRPVPFPATGSMILTGFGSPRVRGRGLDVAPDGNIYVLQQKTEPQRGPDDARDANALFVYGPDGTLKRERVVDSTIRSLNSVRVGRDGSIYLAVGLRPGEALLPPGLEGRVPAERTIPDSVRGVNYYPLMYGSMIKFPPSGGRIAPDAGGQEAIFGFDNRVQVRGAEWIVPGVSPAPSWRTPGTPDICLCESPRFDLDGFDRVFFPDAGRFQAGVLDANGNAIAWFGEYGNPDSAGSGSAVPEPTIPFTWPHVIAVGEVAAYVGDRLAGRVVRVRLDYQAEQTVAVP